MESTPLLYLVHTALHISVRTPRRQVHPRVPTLCSCRKDWRVGRLRNVATAARTSICQRARSSRRGLLSRKEAAPKREWRGAEAGAKAVPGRRERGPSRALRKCLELNSAEIRLAVLMIGAMAFASRSVRQANESCKYWTGGVRPD